MLFLDFFILHATLNELNTFFIQLSEKHFNYFWYHLEIQKPEQV